MSRFTVILPEGTVILKNEETGAGEGCQDS